MTSTNTQGITSITLQFDLSRDIDAAAQDVQSTIAAAQSQLPQGMPSPPSYQKVNPADKPILYLALSSPTLPLSQVDEYAETYLGERISMISGVAQVQVYGAQKYAVRVQVDPQALASRGIGIDEVAERHRQRQCESADRNALRRQPGVHGSGQRPVDRRRRLSPVDRRLSQRLAGAPERYRQRARQRSGQQGRRLGNGQARGRARHPAPARHQHGRGRRQYQEVAADVP